MTPSDKIRVLQAKDLLGAADTCLAASIDQLEFTDDLVNCGGICDEIAALRGKLANLKKRLRAS